jgi:hypothetical protein
LRVSDGWINPSSGRRELRTDLVLEGCGVKAPELVGAVMALAEAGYSIRAVAGTSAGAVTASMVAGPIESGQPLQNLLRLGLTLDLKRFMPNGKAHELFERATGRAPRWPTIGSKLSRLETEVPAHEPCESALAVAMHSLRTAISEWDANALHERTAARTIFVDNACLATTDFDVPKERQYELFLNGVRAATEFIITSAAAGGVPRN